MGEQQDIEQKRTLILCVDRDDDLGVKAKIKTPVVGRRENLDAAVTLAMNDPEETDANAIFEAVRTFDRLSREGRPGEAFEIATLSGSERGGVSADRKLVEELAKLHGSFPANEVILVTDGYSDEAVLPLIESRVPVTSVRRLVVKHSESIEETAAVFKRYLKMLVEEQRYSRYLLGVPGVLIVTLGILSIFNMVSIFGYVFIFFLGIALLIKGFGVDRAARQFYRWSKEYSPPPLRVQISGFAAIAGAICIILGIYLGATNVAIHVAMLTQIPSDIGGWLGLFPQMAGHFIKNAITLTIVGLCIALLGRAIRWYIERDPRLLRNGALIVSILWSRWIFDFSADVLIEPALGFGNLVTSIIIGILIGVASVFVVIVIHRSASGFFEETGKQVEELG